MAKQQLSDKCMEWIVEADFIARTDPRAPGSSFNNDPNCFAHYCNMQANSAEREGFTLIAESIRQTRDIANPRYRSEARATGHVVQGTRVTETRR